MPEILLGNASEESASHNGWFLGHFVTRTDDLHSTSELEVKWGVHPTGEIKPHWTKAIEATTLSILIKGKFHIHFPDRDAVLLREGDYALWSPGVFHRWFAETDSIVLTMRWPSHPNDVVVADVKTTRDLETKKQIRSQGS